MLIICFCPYNSIIVYRDKETYLLLLSKYESFREFDDTNDIMRCDSPIIIDFILVILHLAEMHSLY